MKRFIICLFAIMLAVPAMAYEPPVKKNSFEMPTYTTVGGKTIKNVRIGWEAYGTLNESRDNVILICHYFSGNSHAAGRYSAEDKKTWLLGFDHRFGQTCGYGQVLCDLV